MNTGKKIYRYLKQINTTTGLPTGLVKENSITDPDYIPPIVDYTTCPVTMWRPTQGYCETSSVEIIPITGRLIYDEREKLVNGIVVLTEKNLDGVGEGPYFPPIVDFNACPQNPNEDA